MIHFGLIILTCSLLANQPQPGVLSETIACQESPGQTYAAYLPSYYDSNQKWPVILLFEPAARGPLPVRLFKNAAEEYGYLLFASNNSRNYNEQLIAESVNALWIEVMSRYPVDPNRIYAGGMSGGARVATRIADQTGKLAGVIACAAGYGQGSGPSEGDHYVFAGIMGDLDFNYTEFKGLEEQLKKTGIPFQMDYFEGTHGWPPETNCTRAVEWLELQAMKRKLRPINQTWLKKQFEWEMNEVKQLKDQGENHKAFRFLEKVLSDFEGLVDIESASSLYEALSQQKTVKKEVKKEKRRLNMEKKLRQPYFQRLYYIGNSGFERAQGVENLTWFAREFPKIHTRAEHESNPEDQKVYKRVESSLFTYCFEMMIVSMNQKDYERAEQYYEFGSLMRPKTPAMSYNLACLRAKQEKPQKAIAALEKAIEFGYRNLPAMNADNDLESIRSLDGYKKLVERLQ